MNMIIISKNDFLYFMHILGITIYICNTFRIIPLKSLISLLYFNHNICQDFYISVTVR